MDKNKKSTIKIVFYINQNCGPSSGRMRGNQVCNELNKYYNCTCSKNINQINNSIVIYIKNSNLDLKTLQISKKNNNINVIDIIDYIEIISKDKTIYNEPDLIKNNFNNYVDAYIVNNKIMEYEYTIKYNKFSFVIPHHYDPSLEKINRSIKFDNLKFLFNGYIGHTNNNCLYINELKESLNNFYISPGIDNFLSNKLLHNCCHINIRKTNSWEFKTKPAMKLAHAAGMNCNIITTNDNSILDLLPEDYPYLLKDDSFESTQKMIEYVKETFNTPIWENALETMKLIKSELTLENIVDKYYCLFLTKLICLYNLENINKSMI
jgi:hypothetical protein